jgi:hypothetical protein
MFDVFDGTGAKMNREYLLDSLDGLKAIVFRLLPVRVAGLIACVPMTTDEPWNDAEKAVFQTALGIPGERTFWRPGRLKHHSATAKQYCPSSSSLARHTAVGASAHCMDTSPGAAAAFAPWVRSTSPTLI